MNMIYYTVQWWRKYDEHECLIQLNMRGWSYYSFLFCRSYDDWLKGNRNNSNLLCDCQKASSEPYVELLKGSLFLGKYRVISSCNISRRRLFLKVFDEVNKKYLSVKILLKVPNSETHDLWDSWFNKYSTWMNKDLGQ